MCVVNGTVLKIFVATLRRQVSHVVLHQSNKAINNQRSNNKLLETTSNKSILYCLSQHRQTETLGS
jgi:hypothetical protein